MVVLHCSLFSLIVIRASCIAACPGQSQSDREAKCDHDDVGRVCAQLLESGSPGGELLAWGESDYWAAAGETIRWDDSIRKNNGDSWCISHWTTAILIKDIGCESIHIRCDATDMFYVIRAYSRFLKDFRYQNVGSVNHPVISDALSCLQKKCGPAGSTRSWLWKLRCNTAVDAWRDRARRDTNATKATFEAIRNGIKWEANASARRQRAKRLGLTAMGNLVASYMKITGDVRWFLDYASDRLHRARKAAAEAMAAERNQAWTNVTSHAPSQSKIHIVQTAQLAQKIPAVSKPFNDCSTLTLIFLVLTIFFAGSGVTTAAFCLRRESHMLEHGPIMAA